MHPVYQTWLSNKETDLKKIIDCWHYYVGRDSVDDIEIRNGLDGQGSKTGGGETFAPVKKGPVAHPASYTKGTGSLSQV